MMSVILYYVTAFFVLFAHLDSTNATKDSAVNGEFCYSHNDEAGRCVPFSDCLPYLKLLKERPILKAHLRLVVNLTCTFDLHNPLICCPITQTSNSFSDRQRTKSTGSSVDSAPVIGQKNSKFPSFRNHKNFQLMPSLQDCSLRRGNAEAPVSHHKTVSRRGDFPWIVLLGYLNPLTGLTEFLCGGTIINRRYILTSASCTIKTGGIKPSIIRLSEHDLVNNPDCSNTATNSMLECSYVKDVKVEQIMYHPTYDFRDLGFFQKNDIALIRTAQEISYNDFVRPVCLPFVTDYNLQNSYPERLENAEISIAAGFGKFSNIEQGSSIMNVIPLPIKPNAKCSAFYVQQHDITVDQICASTSDSRSCGPDTGGALMILQKSPTSPPTNKLLQVGIASFGPQYCNHGVPSIYTKITSFLPWILDTIEP